MPQAPDASPSTIGDTTGAAAQPVELPTGPFTAAEAMEAKLDRWTLRRKHVQLFRGVYVAEGTTVDDVVIAKGALKLAPTGSYVSHHTAAKLLGGVVPHSPDIHVTSRPARVKTKGIVGHRAKSSQQTHLWRGVRVTSALQTFRDLAQVLSLVDLVILGDSLVKKKRFTPAQLVAFVTQSGGPHHRKARRAAALVRTGVDSPMETRTRLLIVFAGLPEPAVDHRVYDREGALLRRYDLAYIEFGLIIEYDGRQHAESTKQWHGDIARDEGLDDMHIRRLVIVAKDIFNTPGNTLGRITKAMRERGMTVSKLSDEWRRHFPGTPTEVARGA